VAFDNPRGDRSVPVVESLLKTVREVERRLVNEGTCNESSALQHFRPRLRTVWKLVGYLLPALTPLE
jgi:hypothetical protein